MSAKILALIPLLGWFYLSILGVVLIVGALHLFHKKNLAVIIEKIVVLGIACTALILAFGNIRKEWKETQKAWKSFRDSATAKINQEVGGNYRIYYKTLRPLVKNVHDVNLIGADAREYHFARMYLYPTLVLDAQTVNDGNTAYSIVPENLAERLDQYTEIARVDGHVLMQKKGADVR